MEQISEYRNCTNKINESVYYWVGLWIKNNLPSYLESFEDSISQGQYDSNKWIVKELSKITMAHYEPLHIDIIGSWFAFPMVEMISGLFKIKQIDLFDVDENCHRVAAQYVNHFNYNYRVVQFGNAFERKDWRRRHIVINTSSEHMPDTLNLKSHYKDYPTSPLLVIQSNNYFDIKDHINCVKSEDELIEKNEIKNVYYKGKQSLPLYDRFMVIGRW